MTNQLFNIQTLTNRLDKDTLFETLIEIAEQEFLDYTGRTEVPAAAEGVITNMVVERFNRIGAEGFTSQSYSNINENYTDGYSASILKQLNRYRKVKLL